jgi:glycogen synthase
MIPPLAAFPRKILMTTDTVGGVWTYALELCRALLESGTRVVLVTMGPPARAEQREQVAALPNVRLEESNFLLEWMSEPWDDLQKAGEWLLKLEAKHRPDIIHLNGYVHAALGWRAPVIVVAHSCVYSWWHAVKGAPPPPEWRKYHRAVSAGLHAADLVVAPSDAMAGAIARHYPLRHRPQTIPNGRAPENFHPCAKKEPMILSAGRLWDEAKNIASLAEIAPQLPWPVTVVGEQASPLQSHPAALPNLITLGRRPAGEVADLMARAAIYALPARYEPFGLSALEAALSGCALVLGRIESLTSIWGDAALFVDPEDPAQLRDTLQRLIQYPSQRRALARKATARAQTFTTRRMAERYLAAYQSLLAPLPNPSPRLVTST